MLVYNKHEITLFVEKSPVLCNPKLHYPVHRARH